MNRKYTLILVLFIFCLLPPLWGAPEETGVSAAIRFYDRRIYYLENDPILVQITLTNNGPSPFRFKLADEHVFSVDFDVRTNSNRAVPAADFLVRRRTENRRVFFREISVETGESFSFVENLRDYADLTRSGAYVVQACIYPELFQNSVYAAGTGQPAPPAPALFTNRLTLSVRPRPLPGPDGVPVELDEATNAKLVRENLSPDKVVAYLLTARQTNQWEKFFLYMDTESMISRDSSRGREWRAESEEGRRRMDDRYRQDLRRNVIDADIVLVPFKFEIEKTSYDARTGTVTVMQYFDIGAFIQKKRYEWLLEKKDNVWMIVDYAVKESVIEEKQ